MARHKQNAKFRGLVGGGRDKKAVRSGLRVKKPALHTAEREGKVPRA